MSNLKLNQNVKLNQKIEKEMMNLPVDRRRFAVGTGTTSTTKDSIRQLWKLQIEVS